MHEILKEMPHGVKTLLEKKYNIVDHLIFIDFDNDFLKLSKYLSDIKKEKFDSHDRIIIEHMDTDFYFPGSTVGINLINFFNVIKDLHYPYFVFIFYTNHFGITREIDLLCQDTDLNDRPTVIESFVTNFHYNNNGYTNIDTNIEQIQFAGLCMMNMTRTHRNAVYHSLKDLSPDKIALQAIKPE